LITARNTAQLDDITATSFPYVYAHETIDECIEKLKDYSEDSVPVLDNSNRILGVITAKSVIEVVDDEMGEDYAKLAGLTAEEDLKEPLLESMKKRMPWLIALLGLGILVSGVVGAFEKVVASLTIIMAFQSLILDMAGNVGTQSLAVTIRVLTDENLTFKQKLHLVVKETRVGLFNGILLGVVSFVLVGLYIMLFKGKDFLFAYAVSGCIGVSLIVAMIISSAVGTLIPLFFKKIKIDPAVASGPLITTVNDLVAVVTYYGISWILLLNILHLA
ncbi:MAG: magnesium transporter, partial [Ruminococcus sp.]|nr:magnesium transporter [Ruminococcus sp.]